MNRTSTIAAVAAFSLLTGLGTAACQREAEKPQQTASATLPGEANRPVQGTPGWTGDAPPPVIGAPADNSAGIAERERALAEREAAVAQREAALAQREAAPAPQPPPPPVAPRRVAPRATAHRATHVATATTHRHTTTRTHSRATGVETSRVAGRTAGEPVPPARAPEPPPVTFTQVTVPAGTAIPAEVTRGASSAESQVGDSVTARVSRDVYAGGKLAIPAGALVRGTVTDAHGLGRIGGQARLAVRFDEVELPGGGTAPVYATWSQQGRSETGRDAATIGGSTVGGAILGRVLGRSGRRTERTAEGAAAGAVIGTIIASRTHGQEVELPAGARIDLSLADSVHVTVRD